MRDKEQIAVSVVIDTDLLAKIDFVAQSEDMNRSQYLRKLARTALANVQVPGTQLELAAAKERVAA